MPDSVASEVRALPYGAEEGGEFRYPEGYVYPVGSAPDGLSWTGFVSASRDGTAGTALLFRELDAREEFSLPLADYLSPARSEATVIGGRGEARIEGDVLTVAVRDKLDFVWVKIAPR